MKPISSSDPAARNERSAETAEFQVSDDRLPTEDEWALVILWSAREPARIGEVALLGNAPAPWILGRSPTSESSEQVESDGPQSQGVSFFRQRPPGLPGGTKPDDGSSFVLGDKISRRQMLVRPSPEGLWLENIGRCPLLLNGQEVKKGLAPLGSTIQLREQLLLLCTRRPSRFKALKYYPAHCVGNFGEADAFGIVGECEVVWALRDRLALLAKDTSNENVLITGQSGTGKELAARTIHELSERHRARLVPFNIASITASVAAVQLFGTRKDFPQKGMPETKGLVGAAHQGTLFLDEIGDMPLDLQAILLRVLDEKHEYRRVGDEGGLPLHSDFRLLGATNYPKNMRNELRARFSKYVEVPSLHKRREDIPLLIRHSLRQLRRKGDFHAARFFVGDQPQLHVDLLEHLVHYDYQTHVREIVEKLDQAMAQSELEKIMSCASWLRPEGCRRLDALPPGRSAGPQIPDSSLSSREESLPHCAGEAAAVSASGLQDAPAIDPAEIVKVLRKRLGKLAEDEKALLKGVIETAFLASDGDFTQTASVLGLGRFQLYRMLHRLKWKPVRKLTLDHSSSP